MYVHVCYASRIEAISYAKSPVGKTRQTNSWNLAVTINVDRFIHPLLQSSYIGVYKVIIIRTPGFYDNNDTKILNFFYS